MIPSSEVNESFFEEFTTRESILLNQFYSNETTSFEHPCGLNHSEPPSDYCIECIIIPTLLIGCLVALVVNVVVFASALWIRTPMTPNLKISLSLAAADACSSTMFGILAFVGFYVCVELLRLSGIVITAVHLVALSLNHYIGILKPLHYNSIVTSKKVSALIWLLWLFPAITVVIMCFAFDSEQILIKSFYQNIEPKFLSTFAFRIAYSSLFFAPILVMIVCYTHILIVVKKQQNRWKNLARVGSTRIKGRTSQKISRERKQLEGNIRAIYTTLLILGSCFLGWAPALLVYTLMCPTGCYVEGAALNTLNCKHRTVIMLLRLVDNILIILKMLANPIIYSIRMREIKDGTHRMYMAVTGLFCKNRRNAFGNSGYYYRSRQQNSTHSTMQLRMTSLKSNRNGSNQLAGDKEVEKNTLL